MAPVTRSSVHGRPGNDEQSLVPADSIEFDSDHEDMLDEHSLRDESPLQSAHEMLIPLQETANRVSRQVEEFAKCLDKFNSEREPSEQELWEDAWELLENYSRLAHHRRQHTEKSQPSKQLVKIRSLAEHDRQLASLQLEADLWLLTKQLLVCKSPSSQSQVKESQENGLSELHRYSTNMAIWDAFLNSDETAQEYEGILDWLQQRADSTSPPIEELLSPLTEQSERGDGIWSAGLIYTKDAIKKQKRSRAWPMPLDPSAPGLKTTHIRSHDDEPFVAQMDPDAAERENARLAYQDEFHEQAAWQTCWELLRRGQDTNKIRDWWSDRKESWRSALLLNASAQTDQISESPWLRIINIASNTEWFNRCRQVSEQQTGISEHADAVFGILSGNHMISVEICENMDDMLFSFFNAKLIQRYRNYLVAYQEKLQNPAQSTFSPEETSSDLHNYFETIQADERVKSELQLPHKFIESALLTQRLEDFLLLTGRAAGQMAHSTGQFANLMKKGNGEITNDFAKIASQTQDSVRIIAHLQLLLRSLGFLSNSYEQYEYQFENNIVNYIGYLEKDGKYSLLPLYASKLSPARAIFTLGTILVKITDTRERDFQIKLMKEYGIAVHKVLYAIFQLSNYHNIEGLNGVKDAKQAKKVTQIVDTGSIKSTKIIAGFIGDQVTEQEQKQVQSVEWMKHIDASNWGMAVWAFSTLYKIFFTTGKIAAARELSQAASLASISLSATGMNLSLISGLDDTSENGDVGMSESGNLSDHVQPVSPRKRKDTNRTPQPTIKESSSRLELADQSRTWAQLEQLTDALSALERWQDFADEIESTRGNTTQMRQVKKELQNALHGLQSAMLPLLDKDFLMQASDDAEENLLTIIRNHYVPECIMGYNSALYFAGHALTRRYLVECMNLAQEVAQNDTLTNAFVAAGRMRELVNAFALDSQALLRANEAGGSNDKPKKNKDAANVEGKGDIWQVSWIEEDEGISAEIR